MPLIAPSILSADFLHLGRDITMLNQSDCDWIHVDVMDGHFVPNLSFGFPIIKAVKSIAEKPLDVHLMISNPQEYIEKYAAVGADWITVHAEVCAHLHRVVQQIKSTGAKAGVSLNPHTSIANLDYIIGDLDLVLIMSVNPGFGGQQFIDTTYEKITALKKLIRQTNSKALIQVDGGVSRHNIKELMAAGADVFVAGSAIFGADSPSEEIRILKNS